MVEYKITALGKAPIIVLNNVYMEERLNEKYAPLEERLNKVRSPIPICAKIRTIGGNYV